MTKTTSPQPSIESNPLPQSLAPFFQEYNIAQLDLRRSATTIIERVLQYGNRTEIRWLFQVYSREQIKDWVQRWGNYALPEPHRTFWRLILALPEHPYEN
jgi:hypothetical protein